MKNAGHLLKDVGIIALSIALALFFARTEAVEAFLTSTGEMRVIGSFVAGIFFTSVFTTAPAIVALGEIAGSGSVWVTALVGACGAVIGDLVLFSLVKDRFADHIAMHLRASKGWVRFALLARSRSFRWLSFFAGCLIIASPFPDEIGIGLMGFSKMDVRWFVPLSFAFNFLGILAIAGVVRLAS